LPTFTYHFIIIGAEVPPVFISLPLITTPIFFEPQVSPLPEFIFPTFIFAFFITIIVEFASLFRLFFRHLPTIKLEFTSIFAVIQLLVFQWLT
jgi:hypothetical protein